MQFLPYIIFTLLVQKYFVWLAEIAEKY